MINVTFTVSILQAHEIYVSRIFQPAEQRLKSKSKNIFESLILEFWNNFVTLWFLLHIIIQFGAKLFIGIP